MASYLCPACNSLVSEDRRDAHETMWCPALPSDAEDDEPNEAPQQSMGGARATLSPLCQPITTAEFSQMPSLCFTLEQQDIFGPLDTGAALWYADRVLASVLCSDVKERPCPQSGGLALALGCGGVPLSGLVACALGWDVICTDLEPVLELTRLNRQRNWNVLVAEREKAGRPPPLFDIMEVYFGDGTALRCAMANLLGRPLLLLCSDCIWKDFLHRPLLSTVIAALKLAEDEGSSAEALFCYQRRSPHNEQCFLQILKQEFSCLEVHDVDLEDYLSIIVWPEQIKAQVAEGSFTLFRLTLRHGVAVPSLLPAAEQDADTQSRTPWWTHGAN